MFKSKYIFETKHTRYLRYFKNVIASFIVLFIIYTITSMLFILVSQHETSVTSGSLFKKDPDLVVVFTGDAGRIGFAIKQQQEFVGSKLFITGVYAKNTVSTILTTLGVPRDVDHNNIEIDYRARNTIENVISTIRYLKQNKNMKEVLIISHDYHITRIKLLIGTLKQSNSKVKFYYKGLQTNYKRPRNLVILYKEVFKLMKAYVFLIMWDHEAAYESHD